MNAQCPWYSAPSVDPRLELTDFGGRERLAALGRRHPLVGVGRRDPLIQLAVIQLAGHDRHAPRSGRPCGVRRVVEPQLTFPLAGIRTVALEALVRQDRPDVAREAQRSSTQPARPRRRERAYLPHRPRPKLPQRSPASRAARPSRRASIALRVGQAFQPDAFRVGQSTAKRTFLLRTSGRRRLPFPPL